MSRKSSDTVGLIVAKGYTIIELMLAMLLASFLSIVLVMSYAAIQKRFQLVMTLSMMQDDAQFLIGFLRGKINHAGDVSCVKSNPLPIVQVFTKDTIPSTLKTKLTSLSDVLVLGSCETNQGKKEFVQTAYYVTTTSWQDNGQSVLAFFAKPLDSSRQEIVSHVVDFKLRVVAEGNAITGIGYDIRLQTNNKISRTWTGFAAVHDE